MRTIQYCDYFDYYAMLWRCSQPAGMAARRADGTGGGVARKGEDAGSGEKSVEKNPSH
jgi:hypothetical protein